MSELKIIPLMENNLCSNDLIAEHGLSVYIETDRHKLLADTGPSENTWENAKKRGIDVAAVDTVFLSHGHYDHSGGLMTFAEVNKSADIYLRENAGGEYYATEEWGEKYIGIDKAIMGLPNLHLITGNCNIDEELSVFMNVKPNRNWPKGNRRLHELKDGEYVQDTFSHEMYLVIKYDEKYVLVSGCAHNGILNILDEFRSIYGVNPAIVISGFHMMQKEYTEDDLQKIRETGEELAQMDTIFYSGHCTGEVAYEILKESMGEKLLPINSL